MTTRTNVKTATAWLLSAVGLATLVALGLWASPLHPNGRVDLGQVDAILLDTLAFDNKRYTAALAGIVTMVDDDGTAWVERRGMAFPVVSSDTIAVELMSTVLVVGRLRATERGRWLEAEAWTQVRGIPVGTQPGNRKQAVHPIN